ncbi:MAG: T9SS type A sorting domain-containing protein, partial [Bacteroidales bacterium]
TFGDTVIYPLAGLNEFTADVDLRPDKDIIVRINALLDTITGVIKWQFISLDTLTMDLTEDPMGGFLPPNVTSPEGEGSVSYTVGLKQSLTHGSQIKNKAVIVFDLNPPILTNEWLNTLDTIKPASHVEPLSAVINDTTFNVQWSGSDDGCGLRYYTIYVSENDSAYEPWKSYTSDISAFFTGEFGKTYKFFSIACDSVGNIEDSATSPDAETQLLVSVIENTPGANSLAIIPNPANNQATIEFEITQPEMVTIKINDILGREKTLLVSENKTAGKHRIIVTTTDFENGVYFLNLKTETSFITEKMLIVR